jgi:hypothetical protein
VERRAEMGRILDRGMNGIRGRATSMIDRLTPRWEGRFLKKPVAGGP